MPTELHQISGLCVITRRAGNARTDVAVVNTDGIAVNINRGNIKYIIIAKNPKAIANGNKYMAAQWSVQRSGNIIHPRLLWNISLT